MTSDKDVDLDCFIPYMRDVTRCERALHALSLTWQLIESSAKINCQDEAHHVLTMMSSTRQGFERLEVSLVHSMLSQSVASVMNEMGTSAQLVIDIVVRNLYERTADIGFLATDLPLCQAMAGISNHTCIEERLRAYQSKYTVYDDILLVDNTGKVLHQIDQTHLVASSQDPLIAQSLDSHSYIETFCASDLQPHKRHALIYSQRVLDPHSRKPCGVLCLSFDFASEMANIFTRINTSQGRCVALLLDSDNCVIATSNPHWIALGTQVPTNSDAAPTQFIHDGRGYLIRTMPASDYQGYPGPAGWKGQIMVPLDLAFNAPKQRHVDALSPDIAQGLLSHAQSFFPPLHGIIRTADAIHREVWNGKVMTAGQRSNSSRLKAVLEQIGETGARTTQTINQSIRDLYDNVLSTGIREHQSLTLLLVDLLDRNLYERANDCRWWALSPVLRELLTQHHSSMGASPELLTQTTQTLQHINDLYTVYRRLMVYDREGHILCATHPHMGDGSTIFDHRIDSPTLHAVMQLHGSQSYYVTPWTDSSTGAETHTYIFHAAIYSHTAPDTIVGGIGIVFNAIAELQAMLEGALQGKPHTHAFYVTPQGQVLASTDPDTPAGAHINLPEPHLLQLCNGQSQALITSYQNQYCIVGAGATRGYREFKTTDGYQEDVLAITVEMFGQALADHSSKSSVPALHDIVGVARGPHTIEIASFYIGKQLFAMRAQNVCEALSPRAIEAVSAHKTPYCIGTLALHTQGQIAAYIWVYDLGHLLTGESTPLTEQSQVIVVEYEQRKLGILASALHGVHNFPPEAMLRSPGLTDVSHALINELVKANQDQLLVQCINPQALLSKLQRIPGTPALAG